MIRNPYLALTDQSWFDFLRQSGTDGVVDEVNFWSPRSPLPLRRMRPGEPVFFKLKKPHFAIGGYGFFAHFCLLPLDVAWETFRERNGFGMPGEFISGIRSYRGEDPHGGPLGTRPLACTILRDAVFWPRARWIPWGDEQGWAKSTMRGAALEDPRLVDLLLAQIQLDQHVAPEDFAPEFTLVDADERELVVAQSRLRVGQGAFRSRLLTAYGTRCAITGERTEPVLDAAHVQPYLGPRSNHIQNGLLLTQEFHTLFDRGLLTVTPDYEVRVSSRIRERWSNGKRFYEFNAQPLRVLPESMDERPSRSALEWHNRRFIA